MVEAKTVSSLEKIFIDKRLDDYPVFSEMSAMKNERISFQLAFVGTGDDALDRSLLNISVSGAPEGRISVRAVKNVPVEFPTYGNVTDTNYLSKEPGLYPDLLDRLHYNNSVSVLRGKLSSVWIEIDLRNMATPPKAGVYNVSVKLSDAAGNTVSESRIDIQLVDALLPEQELIYTEWLHCDCLASCYNCDVWSETHWKIIDNFVRTAVSNGINMILTPVFTPPLDTAVGGERLTTQLVDVTAVGENRYEFGFERLDRFADVCSKAGIKYFEISHLFTQWGAHHAPKIVGRVNGTEKKLFGWETDALSDEYRIFVRSFLTAFINHMKSRGDDKRCFYHISDEPNGEQIEAYRMAKAGVANLLEDYVIMDALSDYNFYKLGVVETPIPASNHIATFIDGHVEGLWTYYCCGQHTDVSNRFIAMPSWRNRSIGMQLFKYDIKGFLQWGYNFYNNMLSDSPVNPYSDTSGEYWVPAGDAFSVYPSRDGKALESLRIIVFYEALQDLAAMKLCASLCGREKTIDEIEKIFGQSIAFDKCATDAQTIIKIREKINSMIKENIGKDR